MTRPIAVVRPEPGNAASIARLRAAGFAAISLPLFEIAPLAWAAPDPAAYDAALFTSANTLRYGGTALAALRGLPAFAVGEATATAARAAGFGILATGNSDAAAMVAQIEATSRSRVLHLGASESVLAVTAPIAASIAVYKSAPLPIDARAFAAIENTVVLLHSPRAAERLAMLAETLGTKRGAIRIAALSPAIAQAAGEGWAAIGIAATPRDEALIAAAAALVD